MAANTQKRGKSQSVCRRCCQASIRPLLFVFVHSSARMGVPCGHPREAPSQPHPTSPGDSGTHAALSSHPHRDESIHYLWLSQRSQEVTNGEVTGGRECWVVGGYIPGATPCKLILYHTTNTCFRRVTSGCHVHTRTHTHKRKQELLEAAALSWRFSWDSFFHRFVFFFLILIDPS